VIKKILLDSKMEIEKKILKKDKLAIIIEKVIAEGTKVIAPVKQGNMVNFSLISSASEMTDDYIVTVKSPKLAAFPKIEKLFDYTIQKSGNTVENFNYDAVPNQLLIGARPCDADGFSSLTSIFTWDYKDDIYVRRLEKTTIIGMSCSKSDDNCFCTSVGGNPGSTKGSDILLTPVNSDEYLAEIITEKGKIFAEKFSEHFTNAGEAVEKEKFLANVPVKFNLKDINSNLSEIFESDLWVEQSLRCIGCGACAYVCPTCACFDIQDESNSKTGTRLRLWDSCGLSLFTQHTSGHNPREVQSQRWRQRIMHKFSYMPDRLDIYGCVGCGRCSRACPVDMNIIEHLTNIEEVKK
jgi:sulfhydrogenase subunit beta (sulfur reductase)